MKVKIAEQEQTHVGQHVNKWCVGERIIYISICKMTVVYMVPLSMLSAGCHTLV